MGDLNFLNYKTLQLLGEGGMGKVYLAEDTMLEKKVALKVLNVELSKETLFIERFKQEAKIQSKLVHPNIITLHNLMKDNDTYFIVMEYAEGITLKELISRTGPINESRALKIFVQILEAVGYAHSRNIIHRDLKPSNIMISYNDEVKIMDFGIAKLLGERGLTGTGSKVGTLYYMSPEQIEKPKEVDYRTDLYSLGIVLFEMVTGQLPYNVDTDSDFKLMNEIVNNPIPDPRKYYPHISDKTIELINTLTQKDKTKRYANAAICVNFIKYGKAFDDRTLSQNTDNKLEQKTVLTPVTDKNTELSREIKKNPVEKQEPIAPPPPPPQQKPMTFTPASSPSTPVSSEVKSNIPVATKTKKKTGLFVGIAIVVVLIFVSAIYFALKNFVFNKDEAKINAVITPEKPVQLDSNKVKDALNKYLNDIYTKNKITDTTISKAKDFNFVKPVNDKLEPDLYNPFNGTYDVNTNKLNYSNFSLISFSDNKFKAKYNLDNDEWQFVSEISGTTENNNIVIKEVKYSSVLYIGKEENNSASKPVKETTKIVKEKPPKEKDNPPKEKEKEKPPVWKPNAH